MTGRLRWLRTDRGSASAELVVVIPVLLIVLFFIVYCQRGAEARLRLNDAAHQAARAASQQTTPAAASDSARATATAALDQAGVSCRSFTVRVTGTLQPGSTVTAHVTCTVGLDDLAFLPLPGAKQLTATFHAPVDRFRTTATVRHSGPTTGGDAA
ncbi:TadE/TadG family type IV pilus assembly protein [Streptomyces sp. 4N509B]|uniref:TadE/TadG family type IV pilus assembly protein n=1 Tax=Streptomyces sp. 4N509B TaxID=3457413 RepID=UPI003FD2B986